MKEGTIVVRGSVFPLEFSGEEQIVVRCPVIPGCISQGWTREEAERNIREAIELCLDSQAEEGWTLPPVDGTNGHG